ncbi:MAG: hypothetical protein ABI315_07980 [Bacteroidia bacterium]
MKKLSLMVVACAILSTTMFAQTPAPAKKANEKSAEKVMVKEKDHKKKEKHQSKKETPAKPEQKAGK